MNEKTIGKGKTVEEAINDGLSQLGVTSEEVIKNIIQMPESGMLGIFGKKEAIVEMTLKYNPANIAVEFLTDVFHAMNIECKIDTKLTEEALKINLSGKEMGILIGRRGQTLDSLQYLVSLVVNKRGENYTRVIIDTENYREKRQKTLESLADKISRKVIRYGKRMSLEPMNPYERRIIHAHLQNNKDVFTYSEGEEPYRYVVVSLKDE